MIGLNGWFPTDNKTGAPWNIHFIILRGGRTD
jgi:hypothetical protein